MTWATSGEHLRALLGESIPAGGSDDDTEFTDAQIDGLLTDAGGLLSRAAYAGWEIKAANYASLINVSEGNAIRQMSDLHKHALDMMKHYASASSSLTAGRTRVGRIVRLR